MPLLKGYLDDADIKDANKKRNDCCIVDICLSDLMYYVPFNNFSVMSGCLPGLNQYYAEDKVSCSST